MAVPDELARLVQDIRDDRMHGASELARQALAVLEGAARLSRADGTERFLLEQTALAAELMTARPAMAPVKNIVRRYIEATANAAGDLATVRAAAATAARRLAVESLEAVARISSLTASLITPGDCVLTHSFSSTVAAALRASCALHAGVRVTVTRSGAGRTGERLAAELAAVGMPVSYIDDTAVGIYVTGVAKVLVGADRITADGKLVNGVGTLPLALCARHNGVPVYVLCETLKFDREIVSSEVDLEDRDPEEVLPSAAPPPVTVRNPHFDITPLELVTAVVTEVGVLTPGEVRGIGSSRLWTSARYSSGRPCSLSRWLSSWYFCLPVSAPATRRSSPR